MTNLTITYSPISWVAPPAHDLSLIQHYRAHSEYIDVAEPLNKLTDAIRATQTVISRLKTFKSYNGVDYLDEHLRALYGRLNHLHKVYFELLPPIQWEESEQ